MTQMIFDFSESKALQGDEEVLEKLSSYLNSSFPKLTFKTKTPLKELFPEPENRMLRAFWGNNSHADISVFRHSKLVCILEPGGSAHVKDKKQKIRDKKKDRICHLNGVNVLRFFNSVLRDIGKSKLRKELKKGFYSDPEKFWRTKF